MAIEKRYKFTYSYSVTVTADDEYQAVGKAADILGAIPELSLKLWLVNHAKIEPVEDIDYERPTNGIYNLSPIGSKLYFSKSPCRCCGSTLEGYRRTFTGTVGKAHNNKRIKLSCCLDCFDYLFT